jgi:hypothetical protein
MSPPQASSSPIRGLFITEGLMKLAGGLIFIGSPRTILAMAMPPPIPSSSLLLTRMLGTQTFTLGISMLLASSNAPAAVASRRVVYWTIFARDATLVAALGWQLWLGDSDAPLALSREGLKSWILEITPFLFGHLWILMQRPQWFVS